MTRNECPVCRVPGEPEADGSTQYFECYECGSQWGFVQVADDHHCSAGVPEGVRRAASQFHDDAVNDTVRDHLPVVS